MWSWCRPSPLATAFKGERAACSSPGEPSLPFSNGRQVEEEREELGKMVVKAKKELVAAIQLQLEEAREQMQDEEEFVVCKYDKILYSQIVGWKTHFVTF